MAEKLNEIEKLTKIKKNSKILIEVKQNTSLITLFNQIKITIDDLKIFLPGEEYYYFGFVNESNAKKGLNKDDDFIESIKNYERANPKYKIFLFIIKNNTLFHLELSNKVDYATFYRNEIKNEINEMNKKFTSEITGVKKDITGIKEDITELKDDINGLRGDMEEKFKELFNMISEYINKDQKSEKTA